MIAAAYGNNAATALLITQTEQFIECSARLEGPGLLEQLVLHKDIRAKPVAETFAAFERRSFYIRGYPLLCGPQVLNVHSRP